MRDLKINTSDGEDYVQTYVDPTTSETVTKVISGWNLDIDIINGESLFVDNAEQTNDQRAALAAYTINGMVPGADDIGINWDSYYAEDGNLMQVNNQITQVLQELISNNIEEGGTKIYIPVYERGESGIKIKIVKGEDV